MLLRHLQQIILKVRISSGSKTFCKRLKKNDLSFFLKVATFDSDFISQGSAFHMYGILIKNEFLKRDVLALLMFRNCRDVPLRDRPVQKEKYLENKLLSPVLSLKKYKKSRYSNQ